MTRLELTMKKQRDTYYVADFETTVYKGQENTEAWAAAIVEFYTENVVVLNSIDLFFDKILGFNGNSIIYFHNLKFDGEFILSYLLTNGYVHRFNKTEEINDGFFTDKKHLKNKEFIYSISSKGLWYSITLKNGVNFIEFRDSYKLIPASLKRIGESFNTKHKKLNIKYSGFREAKGVITQEEKDYISNDVLVIKEALEIMHKQGHTSLTIGACCLQEYKAGCMFYDYYQSLPNLYEIEIPPDTFGVDNVGKYIRRSYRGGWCYVVNEKRGIKYRNGITLDVNSLYPSMMHSESGNVYPIGKPQFWVGNYIPDEAKKDDKYFFVRIKTQFLLKENKLPCIQVKGSPFYRANEWLKTSDVFSLVDHKYHSTIQGLDGKIKNAYVILTLTQTDFDLIREHYNLYNTEILDGCYFRAVTGIFDEYIDKYREIKMNSKGAVREIAKLFLNNLYGKMATSTDSSFKYAFIKDDGSLGYNTVIKNDKKPGYIPIGSAVTSYARNFTIRAAQKNYYGASKPGFIYADTDSIHCDIDKNKIKGVDIASDKFCCWKLESEWEMGVFIRQKTYAELSKETGKWDIKCAGMPDPCKKLLDMSITGEDIDLDEWSDFNVDEIKQFLSVKRTIDDFNYGLKIPGKLMPKHIKGGIVLEDTIYTMKENNFLI